jgi:flagellar hook-associated protein 2
MSDLALSGIASGIDTSGLIDQMLAADRQSASKFTTQQTQVQARQDALKTLVTRLNNFKAAADALSDPASWKPIQSATSSDDSHVGVTLLGGAGIGGHTVQVDRLASSAQLGFNFTPSTSAQSFDISYANDSTTKVTVNVAANATIDDVASAINGTSNSPAAAVVITTASGDKRLVLAARKTGADSALSVDTTKMADGQLTADASLNTRDLSTLNASIKLDGTTVDPPPQSNVIENLIPGVRLTLKGVTSTLATVTVTTPQLDSSSIKSKVNNFISAYNSLVEEAENDVNEKPVAGASSTFDLQQGQLFGDSGLSEMLDNIRQSLQTSIGGLGGYDTLADIGITLPKSTGGASSDDAKSGKLTIDNTALDAALAGDSTQLQALFGGKNGVGGFTKLVDSFVTQQTGNGHGILDDRITAADSEIKSLKDQLSDANDRITQKQDRLKTQFAAMETALGQLQSQQSWLTGQIGGLPSWR